MKSPILGSSYVARSVNAADNRMVNLFPEIVAEGGKEPVFLQRAPGLRLLGSAGSGPVRGAWSFGGYGYLVSGATLYRVTSAWVVTALGTVAGTGPVSMADNGTQLFIAANPTGYIYNSSTGVFAQITDPDFPGAVTVGYLDGYFVFNEPDSQRLWVTSLLDGTAVDPLDFASAEGNPDNVVAIIVDHREVWVFGTNSTEVWYNSGDGDFPLTRIQGAFNELGCVAPYSVAKMDNQIYWVGVDARGQGIVYRTEGYVGRRVSTHAMEWQLQQLTDLADTVAFTYQRDGHSFYQMSVPSAETSWDYDAATQAWHERGFWTPSGWAPHRASCQMFFANETVVGDRINGNFYALDPYTYDDNGDAQRWYRSWRALPTDSNDLKRTVQHNLQLDCETGVGLNGYSIYDPDTDPLTTEAGDDLLTQDSETIIASHLTVVGADPQVILRWSDDGGHTWSNEHQRSMGRIGVYGYRTIWRRLGMTLKLRDRVYEVSGSDPVPIAIMGAELTVGGTNG